MIDQPTVLILGAGASMPYGFPSGPQMKEWIIGKYPEQYVGDYESLRNAGFRPKQRILLEKLTEQISDSQCDTIDVFLEHQPELQEDAKLAIAYTILKKENKELLRYPHHPKGGCYQIIKSKLCSDVRRIKDFEKNRLSVLTFNYDCSLENFLVSALEHTYGGCTPNQAQEMVESIPIIHLHGRVKRLPWKDSNCGEYGDNPSHELLEQSAKGIKIVHNEQIDNSPEFLEAWSLLKKAERIFFLGFGFYERSIHRLFKAPFDGEHVLQIMGMAYDVSDPERNRRANMIKKYSYSIKNLDNPQILFNTTADAFLNGQVVL